MKMDRGYRCDVCGKTGFWNSDGFDWARYGPMEGDGLDTCSEGCREAAGDPSKAFAKLFRRHRVSGGWDEWDRRHRGLLNDPAPVYEPEEPPMFEPTSSGGEDPCPCPQCDTPIAVGGYRCAACGLRVKFEREVRNHCIPRDP